MRYELRTRFSLKVSQFDEADDFLRWLYENVPTAATMGLLDVAPQWLGNRYPAHNAVFEIVTQYPNVFAATADRLRIAKAVEANPYGLPGPEFEVLRVYGDAELGTRGDRIKPHTWP